jgi:hypothetical protein
MTLEKLAAMTQAEFRALRGEMADMRGVMTTKEDLKGLEVRVADEVSRKVIESNDRVMTKLDVVVKDLTAHDSLHNRITEDLHDHDTRIKKLEKGKAA